MTNRILRAKVHVHILDPAQAELWITVSAEHVTPTTELRGRLAGPRCLYAATIEVGYPLRPFSRRPSGLEGLAARVVIPEPSLWEPQCPFVYQGTVELWQDGERCDQAPIRCGLRRMTLRRDGLSVNGRRLVLKGRSVSECDEKQIALLHRDGCNLLLARTTPCLNELLPFADAYGFLVLGVLKESEQKALDRADALANHPSFLGWLLKGRWDAAAVARLRGGDGAWIGVELGELPAEGLGDEMDFIVCPADVAAKWSEGEETSHLPPMLLLGSGPDAPSAFGRVD